MRHRAADGPPWRAALTVQTALAQAAWFGIKLMAGYRALAEGADPALLGVLTATIAVPSLVLALPVGRLSDRLGGSVLMLVGMVTMIAGIVAMLALHTLWTLFPAVALIAVGQLFSMVGQQTFVAHRTAVGSSDRDFGTLSSAASMGQLLGAPLATSAVTLVAGSTAATHPDTTPGIIATLACAVLAVPTVILLGRTDVRRGAAARAPRGRPLDAVRAPGLWRALVVSAAVLVTVDLIYGFIPAWALEHQVDIGVVGWLLAIRAIVSMSSRLGLSRLVMRFGRKRLIAIAMSLGVVSLVALPLVGAGGAVPVMIGLGIALGLPQPLTMAWVVSVSRPENRGAALSLRITANRLAQITIPVAVSAASAGFGVLGIFWTNAVFLLGSIVFLARSDPDAGSTASGPAAPEGS